MSQVKNLIYKFDDFRLDTEKETLACGGASLPLTRKAWQILLILVQNANQTVEKDEIYTRIWSDRFVEEANLTQYIYLLRKTLKENSGEQNQYIETVPYQGYRFNGEVSEIFVAADENETTEKDTTRAIAESGENSITGEEQNLSDLVDENESDQSLKTFGDDNPSQSSNETSVFKNDEARNSRFSDYRLIIGGIAAFLLILAVISYRFYFAVSNGETNNIKSVAVLPFNIIGTENPDNKLGLGMADAVITRLGKLRVIQVRPTSAVFRYLDSPPDSSAAAGRALGVDSVLEGTVQYDDIDIRVSVRLINTANGNTLWAENFNEKFSDIFGVQDLISARIAETLSLKLTSRQELLLADRETSSAEAFQYYQLGNYFWNRRGKEDLEKAVGYFQKATRLDKNYARAYAALADTYALLGYYRYADAGEMIEKTTRNASIALKLNSDFAEPYIALAIADILNKEYLQAQEKLERAVALAPFNSSARHRYAVTLLVNGKLDEGVAQMRRAQEYDSLSPVINRGLCNVLIAQRNYSEAVRFCETAEKLTPDTPGARVSLAYAYFLDKNYDKAEELLNSEVRRGKENDSLQLFLAYFYAKTGRRAEAEKIYAGLKPNSAKDPSLYIDLTLTAYALGKKQEAAAHYRKMLEIIDSDPESIIYFAYDQTWDEIKSDPDFERIYRQFYPSQKK